MFQIIFINWGVGRRRRSDTNGKDSKSQIYFCCYNFEVNYYKADPLRTPFTALRYEELGLLISAREVDLVLSD